MDDGRPFVVSSYYTLSLSPSSTLRAILEQWRNRPFTLDELNGFDLKNILGQFCMVSILNQKGNDGKNYCKVQSVSPVPAVIKKAGLPDGVNDIFFFTLDEFDQDVFMKLSETTRKKIVSSPEYINATTNKLATMKDDNPDAFDNIPF
jgi:hypothetical protein